MENNIGGNFRSATDPFTMVCNTVIEDKNLSMKAKGLYLIIKHYITIPNFILNKGYLMSLSKEGERAFDSTWKELKDAGYLKQYRLKGNGGKWVYEYELLHLPQIEVVREIKQIKKPSTSAKVNGYNDKVKSGNSSNKSICNPSPHYTPVPNKNIQENNSSEPMDLVKEARINIKKADTNEVNEKCTNIDALKIAINNIKGKSHGINALMSAYNEALNGNSNKGDKWGSNLKGGLGSCDMRIGDKSIKDVPNKDIDDMVAKVNQPYLWT
jgi:hypothetical protein